MIYLCIRFPKNTRALKEEFFDRFIDKQLVVQVFTCLLKTSEEKTETVNIF